MRKYWAKVAKRAFKEAGVAVFTSPERAVISFLLQAAVGLLLFIALGEADVGFAVRLASAFAPFLLFPLVFLWKMVTVPVSMHEAHRREDNSERVAQVWYLSQLYVEQGNPPNAYYIQHGLALPPEDWINSKLEELGFAWRYRFIQGTQYVTEDVNPS